MTVDHSNAFDRAVAGTYERREADWRNGAVVYQVLVDRFAPAADLAAKRHLYPSPKVLKSWDETPRVGVYLDEQRFMSHEIEFWGGDLASTRARLDYVAALGVDVLYLNPIHLAYTNHGYDALDFAQVAPALGDRADVVALADALHERGMRLVLDGVFNHMGRYSARFRDAEANPESPYRDWFVFGDAFPGGVRTWMGAQNLPELALETRAVTDYLYAAPDSIVRAYLRDGVDGWRIDAAFDLGPYHLAELTAAAHEERSGALVVGEIPQYPKEWFPAVDAVMNFTLREIVLGLAARSIPASQAGAMTGRLFAEPGFEHLLKSWIVLDNHDTPRLRTLLPDDAQRRLAQLLQYTLPGAPNLYYGSELGMVGGADPEMRAPMRWELVDDGNAELAWMRRLIALHNEHRALRIGDFRGLDTHALFGFERYTDRVADAVLVLVNASDCIVTESVLVADSKLVNGSEFIALLASEGATARVSAGMLHVTVPADGFLVLSPDLRPSAGYSAYKRTQ